MANLMQTALRVGRASMGITPDEMAAALRKITPMIWTAGVIQDYETGRAPHIDDGAMCCLYDAAFDLFRQTTQIVVPDPASLKAKVAPAISTHMTFVANNCKSNGASSL